MKLLLVIPFLFLWFAAPADLFATEKSKLTMTGSSTIAPLILEISKSFEQENKNIRIDVQTGGSSRGIADARKGLADIGMASRSLKTNESDVHSHTIAIDSIGLIVHEKNPIQNLTKLQFTNVLTGATTNWSDLGGPNQKIIVVNRAEGRSELELVANHLGIKPSQIKADLIVGENAHCIKTVSRSPWSISYMSSGHAGREQDLGVPIKVIRFEGIEASFQNIQNGTYPLARPLNLITNKQPSGMIKKFIDFASSIKVRQTVEEFSFIPAKR